MAFEPECVRQQCASTIDNKTVRTKFVTTWRKNVSNYVLETPDLVIQLTADHIPRLNATRRAGWNIVMVSQSTHCIFFGSQRSWNTSLRL